MEEALLLLKETIERLIKQRNMAEIEELGAGNTVDGTSGHGPPEKKKSGRRGSRKNQQVHLFLSLKVTQELIRPL